MVLLYENKVASPAFYLFKILKLLHSLYVTSWELLLDTNVVQELMFATVHMYALLHAYIYASLYA